MKEKVKRLCKEQGKTLKDLAADIGIARESLTRALDGNPKLSTIQKIAKALKVEAWQLLTDSTIAEALPDKDLHGVLYVDDKPILINSIKEVDNLLQLAKMGQTQS